MHGNEFWLHYFTETFVLSELLKHLAFSEKSLTLWHYRTQSNMVESVFWELSPAVENFIEFLEGSFG